LDRFDACVAHRPAKAFLHYGENDVTLSFAQVRERTDCIAGGLAAAGVRPGDRVCVFSRNALLSVLAIWRAGAVFAPINFYYKGRLLTYQVRDTAPAAIITDLASASLFEAVREDIGAQFFIVHSPRPGDHDHDPAASHAGFAGQPGVTGTRRSATPAASMPATRTVTASARCMSTRWRGSGRCCAPGCVRIGVSRRTSCRTTSASSSSCTMRADAAKPCSAPSSQAWWRDGPVTIPEPDNSQERYPLHAMTARSKQAVQTAIRTASAVSTRNR